MQEQVTALESQLREKEQLVSALTERLEQAAEQLDRIRRTGGDRGLRMPAGIPVELVEEQKALVDDLSQAVQHWEDMQAGATLGRIETQVSELRDLLVGNGAVGAFSAPEASSFGGDEEGASLIAALNAASSATSEEAPAESPGGLDSGSYEALKAGLLKDRVEETATTGAPAEPTAHNNSGLVESIDAELASIESVDEPKPVDFEAAENEDLRQAIEIRDNYIFFLIKKIRVFENTHMPRVDWAALESAPEELRTRMEERERRLDALLRLAEVEQSLERARLGREAMRLQQLEQQIEKEMKRLSLNSDDGDEEFEDDNEPSRGSRWMRLLGKQLGDDLVD